MSKFCLCVFAEPTCIINKNIDIFFIIQIDKLQKTRKKILKILRTVELKSWSKEEEN